MGIATTIVAVLLTAGVAAQTKPRALTQGPRAFELAELTVAPGPRPGTRLATWTVSAKPDAPQDKIFLVIAIRESGGTPYGLLRLEAADVNNCKNTATAQQIEGWGDFETCRVQKPPVLIGWRLRAAAPAAQLRAGKMQVVLDNLP